MCVVNGHTIGLIKIPDILKYQIRITLIFVIMFFGFVAVYVILGPEIEPEYKTLKGLNITLKTRLN